jgi:diguanylate cyclase (GGDEF)-like protein
VAGVRERTTRAFTDPLDAHDGVATRWRIRRVHAVTYGAAAVSLLLALLTDGGPASQRIACAAAMAGSAVLAVLMLACKRMPDPFLVVAFPLAGLTVTAVVVLDPPLALTPMFYVWPLMTAAYFLPLRPVVFTYALLCGSFGVAMLWAYDSGPRLIEFLSVAIVGAVVVGFVRALTSGLDELLKRLLALAREDPLTGVLNRRAFMERLDAELGRVARTGEPCSVAVLDVDHFKVINDRFGHAAGDSALRGLVAAVSQRLRRGDAVGRLGGEEFVVLLAGTGCEHAAACAEELRVLVAREAQAAGMPFTVSVGVASVSDDATTVDAVLAAADAALYRAKREGRDTVRSAA